MSQRLFLACHGPRLDPNIFWDSWNSFLGISWALDRIFWYWNLLIWRLILKIFQSLAQMLILTLSSFIFDILRPTPNNVEFQSLKLILGISIPLVQTFEWGIFETTSIDSAKKVFRDAWFQNLKCWCWLLLWHVFLYILAWNVSLI